jgi:hypothetical protein
MTCKRCHDTGIDETREAAGIYACPDCENGRALDIQFTQDKIDDLEAALVDARAYLQTLESGPISKVCIAASVSDRVYC